MKTIFYRNGPREPHENANGALRHNSIRTAIREKWVLVEDIIIMSWSQHNGAFRIKTRFSNVRRKQLRCMNDKERRRFFTALNYVRDTFMGPDMAKCTHSHKSRSADSVKSNGCCFICRGQKDLTTHHIIPREVGGTNDERNLMSLCETCHDLVTTITNEIHSEAGHIGKSPHFVDYVALLLEIKSRKC